MSAAASPTGRKSSDVATDGSSTTSPMLQAVEPTLPDADNADEEEEEVLVLTPAKSTAATAAAASSSSVPAGMPSQDEVDWPAEMVESHAHYSSHLWFSVDRVLSQADAGRTASKEFVQFVREKSDLDREYAEKLRKLAGKWGTRLNLPVRPRTTDTFQAACCALRNLCTNVAANSDTLANKLDEEVADVFLYEAQDLGERVKVISSDAKESLNELQEAMQVLESTKRHLMKSCEQMAELEDNEDDDAPAAAPQVQRKESAVDFLTDAFVAPFKSSAETLTKKIAKEDAKYVQAIKNVREVRQEYDVSIRKHLQSLERVEVERMRKMHSSLQKFSLIHLQCFQSHVKNIGAVYQTLSEKIKVTNDVEWFVRDCLASNPVTMSLVSSKSQGDGVLIPLPERVNPPPLPSKRLFKGHPDFEATRNQQQRGAPTRKTSSRFEVTDEPTDSENDNDDVEELTLSSGPDDDDAGDDSEEELLQSVNSTPARNTTKSVAASSLVSPVAASAATSSSASIATTPSKVSMPASQTEVPLSADQLSLIQSLVDRILQLPFFSTATPASPITLEPERTQVLQLLQKGFGKVAFVTALKKALPPLVPVSADNKKDSALESPLDAKDSAASATTDPFAVPLQPELSISRDAFEQLYLLCVELLNSSQEDMHVQPVNSLMTTARSIVCSEAAQTLMEQATDAAAASAAKQKQTPKSGKKNKKGNKQAAEEEEAADASSAAAPAASSTPTTLFSRLSSHVMFTSPRYYEVSFLAALDRAVSKRANVQPWHTSTEQKQREVQQRILASNMIKNAAADMADIGALSDAQIVAFVDKMAHVQQLDNSAMENLAQSIPSFERMGLSHMPSANASAAGKFSLATSSPP